VLIETLSVQSITKITLTEGRFDSESLSGLEERLSTRLGFFRAPIFVVSVVHRIIHGARSVWVMKENSQSSLYAVIEEIFLSEKFRCVRDACFWPGKWLILP
jgi:hypothetical protein